MMPIVSDPLYYPKIYHGTYFILVLSTWATKELYSRIAYKNG